MTADAVWNGGMETLGILDGEAKRKRDKCGMAQRATGKFQKAAQRIEWKAPLSCRRERRPASVIVMRIWLALAGVLPAALVFKRSCQPLPRQAKARQDGLGTGNRQPEIVAGADSRLPCPASGGISAVKRKVKKKNG